MESQFQGFPLLAEFLQGGFWFTFHNIQTTHLVSFLSLILYIYFLKVYCQIPLYLSLFAFLAIPLVQIHATSSYVDLPGNIGLSILIVMAYLLYTKNDFLTKRNFLVIFLAATFTANIKFQLIPLVFLILCFIFFKIIFLKFQEIKEKRLQYKWLLTALPTICIAAVLIFATPLKNTFFYGNPFYPVRIEVAGTVLNHKVPLYQQRFPDETSRPQRWLYSILEIRSDNWSIDQANGDPLLHRMGGFFGAYVIFHLLLLGYICCRETDRETRSALLTVIIMSIVAAFMPQSHELRYYMYWIISLVSLNLYLVTRLENSRKRLKFINTKTISIVCLLALTIVLKQTRANYVRPIFYTFDKFIQSQVNTEVLQQIKEGDKVCIVGMPSQAFLFASKFHPQLNYSYSVKAAESVSECGTYKKLLVNGHFELIDLAN
jgi:hypothetical protein